MIYFRYEGSSYLFVQIVFEKKKKLVEPNA